MLPGAGLLQYPTMRPTKDPRAGLVLSFWFGNESEYGERRKEWFRKDAAFDAEIEARFRALHEEAARGDLEKAGVEAPSQAVDKGILDQRLEDQVRHQGAAGVGRGRRFRPRA